MGRPKIKIIDDSQVETEIKGQRSKIKAADKDKQTKSEVVETSESVIASPEGAKQSSPDNNTNKITASPSAPRPSAIASEALRAGNDKITKPGKAKPRSKKYQKITEDLDRNKSYPLTEAVDMVKKVSYSKFNATLEAHINTAQTGIRGLVSLPFAKGRELRILCFGPSDPKLEGVIFGSDSDIEEINKQSLPAKAGKGKIDFDLVITTPQWMPKLAKVARILGPRGLMPNPKNGTITEDPKKAVESFQAGKTEYEHSSKQVYKTESKAPVIHLAMGKLDQPTEELTANIKTLLQTLGKSRYKKVTLSPTMGPGIKVDLSSI